MTTIHNFPTRRLVKGKRITLEAVEAQAFEQATSDAMPQQAIAAKRRFSLPFVGKTLRLAKAPQIIGAGGVGAKQNRYFVLHPATFNALQEQLQWQSQELQDLSEMVAQLRTQLVSIEAPDPLAAAKARGMSYTKAEWQKPTNLNLAAAAGYSRRSDRMINAARNRGELYALVLDGNQRGFRYPQWQFDAEPARLAPVLQALPDDASCWSKHQFLTRPNDALDGRSPKDVILDPQAALAPVLAAAHHRYAGDQGAA